MKPEDVSIDEFCNQVRSSSHQGIGSPHQLRSKLEPYRPGFNFLFSDGSVQCIPADTPPDLLRAALEGKSTALAALGKDTSWPRATGWHALAALAGLVASVAVLVIRARRVRDDRAVRTLLAILQRH